MAAKRTAELIPLCHPLPISSVRVDLIAGRRARRRGDRRDGANHRPTGVEMEALTAASVAALTVYDMCKAVDRGMRIDGIRVVAEVRRQIRRFPARTDGRRRGD